MTRTRSFCDALNEAVRQAMEADPTVILMGEGVDDPRAVFGSTRGLKERFGEERVFDIPLAENGMSGVAVGAALTGLRPVMTHQRLDFMLYAMDQIVNQAAKRCYSSGGRQSVPLTIRAIVGRGWGQGSQHSQSLQSWFAHVPGLKVVMPSTSYDAKGLLLSAIQDPNPVICIEHRKLYDHVGEVPEEAYTVPIGVGRVHREGTDVTIVAFSYMLQGVQRALPAIERAGISAEVIDPRSARPLDEEMILRSVRKTGRLVVCDTGWACCGLSAEVACLAAERAFQALKAPIRRVALPDVPTPTSRVLEDAFYPGPPEILRAVWDVMGMDRALPDVEDPVPMARHGTADATSAGPF